MNWKGVIPAITTPFNADLRVDHGSLAEHVALDGGQRLHRPRPAGLAGRGRHADRRREAPGAGDLRARGGRPGAGRSRASRRSPRPRRWRSPRTRARSAAGPHGAAALRLQQRLAGDARARGRRAATRPSCPACSTTTRSRIGQTSRPSRSRSWPRRVPEPGGRQGVEHGRAPRDRHPRAPGRPPGRAGRAWTTRSSRASPRVPWAGSPAW